MRSVKEVDACSWDMTVWRVRWGPVVLKVYDKAGRVLRVEVKVLNTAGLGCGKGLGKLGEQLSCLQGMLERFLASLQAAHVAFLDQGQFERWAEPSQRGNRRLAGLDLNKARNRTVIAALGGLATRPEGFTTADLAQAVRGRTGWEPLSIRSGERPMIWPKCGARGWWSECRDGGVIYRCRRPLFADVQEGTIVAFARGYNWGHAQSVGERSVTLTNSNASCAEVLVRQHTPVPGPHGIRIRTREHWGTWQALGLAGSQETPVFSFSRKKNANNWDFR